MADGRHLENRYDVITPLRVILDSNEIWYADGQPPANDSEKAKIETTSRITV